MSRLTEQEKRRLTRLGPALGARKRADMARYAEARAECDRIDAEIAAVEASIRTAAAHLDLEELADYAQFETWRSASRDRLAALAEQRGAAAERLEERREALVRSNGDVEALKRLVDR